MRWVVDASVAAKWFAPESDAAAAQQVLGGELHAADLQQFVRPLAAFEH